MILTHGANSIERGFNYGSVEVDGEVYKTLTYGSKIWIVENFRNDIATNYNTTHGRLYKYSDALYAIEDILTDGWRLPTKQDFDDLISLLGTTNPLDWISKDFGGTNKNGFDVTLNGYVNVSGEYLNNGVRGYIWTITSLDSYKYNFYADSSYILSTDYASVGSSAKTKLAVRIVKDV